MPHNTVLTRIDGDLDAALDRLMTLLAIPSISTDKAYKADCDAAADWLVREADIPFREAHHITGAAVKLAESRGVALDSLPLADLQDIDRRIDARVFDALSVDASVAARASYGGTAPDQVRARVAEARSDLGMET